jgi:hypothetical protein
MINKIFGSILKANDTVHIHKNHFENGHISQIHFKKIRNFYLTDKDFNNYSTNSKLNTIKEKIIEHYNKSNIEEIPVEFHNYVRCEIQSTMKSFKNSIVPSIIGQKLTNLNHINNDGIKIDTYFSFFKNFSIEEKTTFKIVKNNYYNIYLGTFISKTNNVYIQLHSPHINWLFYNYQLDFNTQNIEFCFDPEYLDDIFITYAEKGYTKIEIEKLKKENKYWEKIDNQTVNNWGLNWGL